MSITATAIAYLESKTPTWVKVSVALLIVVWALPLKTQQWFHNSIDTRVHAVITPMRRDRDSEIKAINIELGHLHRRANETNQFVRAMALEQLGAKRYQEINLTAIEQGK